MQNLSREQGNLAEVKEVQRSMCFVDDLLECVQCMRKCLLKTVLDCS